MHDGRATTLMSAIAEHGGDGANARAAVRNLPVQSQRDLIAFLNNLVIGEFNAPSTPPPPPPAQITVRATVATQTDWGAGFCQVLTVTNTGTTTANTWSVVVNFNGVTITQMWNGNRTGNTGQVTVSSIAPWQALAPGQSTNQTGWCANRNVANSGVLPAVVSASGM
jgi:cellulase/cellobiase CelA1